MSRLKSRYALGGRFNRSKVTEEPAGPDRRFLGTEFFDVTDVADFADALREETGLL
jgi:hypothetical protein